MVMLEDRQDEDVSWRYSKNPVIDRYHIPSSNTQPYLRVAPAITRK